jgi:hypothetical protein
VSTRLLAFLCTALGCAVAAPGDKRAYSWANPTPGAQLRELTTDRPDATESPFTIDAGHAQLELDLVNYSRNQLDGVRTIEWGVAPFNLRVGVRHNFELGIFVTPYVHATAEARNGPKETASGLGDTTFRAKWNFFGNDGGTACGLIVDLKVPTAQRELGNDRFEGGFVVPVAFDLPGGWSCGAMTGVAAQRVEDRHRAVFTTTITFAHDLTDRVGGFLELTSEAGGGAHVCTFDLGLAWQLDRNRQLDCGVNLGVSRLAPDVSVFTGYSQRF